MQDLGLDFDRGTRHIGHHRTRRDSRIDLRVRAGQTMADESSSTGPPRFQPMLLSRLRQCDTPFISTAVLATIAYRSDARAAIALRSLLLCAPQPQLAWLGKQRSIAGQNQVIRFNFSARTCSSVASRRVADLMQAKCHTNDGQVKHAQPASMTIASGPWKVFQIVVCSLCASIVSTSATISVLVWSKFPSPRFWR